MDDAAANSVEKSGLSKAELEEGKRFAPRYGPSGLIPAIVTDAAGAVLMFAYMNEEALRLTLKTGEAHFWSRSRGAIWRKGETSGNRLLVREIRTDCDQDVLWLKARLEGEAVCHTGRPSCFYRRVLGNEPSNAVLEFAKGDDGL
ncbi:MAG TPA: phosphoribosyl-AMP cyclohydrolase [Hyphomicrobiales bacterium]|nr:phosphoribosyl-AMP cyclohydrolase [Hyphomicrobiales bacterium]